MWKYSPNHINISHSTRTANILKDVAGARLTDIFVAALCLDMEQPQQYGQTSAWSFAAARFNLEALRNAVFLSERSRNRPSTPLGDGEGLG